MIFIFNDDCDCTKKGFDRERNMAQTIFVLLMVHDSSVRKMKKAKVDASLQRLQDQRQQV